ncbi:MAG: PleD family two-component system response regulator [Xanthobacteraceae bacterium]
MDIGAVKRSAWTFVLDEPTRVLIVDDDPILLEFATVHLSSPSAVIETAPDGATAWSMLTSGHFDVVLLDIVMPGPDGFSLLEKIRAEPKLRHLPVMMLTGHEDIVTIDRAYSLGANSFIAKPVNWRLLSYHVRCVLRSSQLERERTGAPHHGVAEEAPCHGAPLAFEVEYRNALQAILRDAETCHGSGSSTQAAVQRIAALASRALAQCDPLTDHTTPVDASAAAAAASVLA